MSVFVSSGGFGGSTLSLTTYLYASTFQLKPSAMVSHGSFSSSVLREYSVKNSALTVTVSVLSFARPLSAFCFETPSGV